MAADPFILFFGEEKLRDSCLKYEQAEIPQRSFREEARIDKEVRLSTAHPVPSSNDLTSCEAAEALASYGS